MQPMLALKKLDELQQFSALIAVCAILILSTPAFSQTPGGRAALAAKQRIKTEVQDAMADGKISRLERAEILADARQEAQPVQEEVTE